MGTEIYWENLKEEANWGGTESKSDGNIKIGTLGNPQRKTQRRIPEDPNPKKSENLNPHNITLDLLEIGFRCKNVIRFDHKRGQWI
jgi:hypothetical protein